MCLENIHILFIYYNICCEVIYHLHVVIVSLEDWNVKCPFICVVTWFWNSLQFLLCLHWRLCMEFDVFLRCLLVTFLRGCFPVLGTGPMTSSPRHVINSFLFVIVSHILVLKKLASLQNLKLFVSVCRDNALPVHFQILFASLYV